eukprot:UN08398
MFFSLLINTIFSINAFSKQFRNNPLAVAWRHRHKCLVIFIRIISSFDLSLILLLTSKIWNKSWSAAPFHPIVMEHVQFVSVISKLFIENIAQLYVTADLLNKFSSWDPDTHPTKTILSPISITALAVTCIDIAMTIYMFFVYSRDKHKHPRHQLKGSNVQIGHSGLDHEKSSGNYKTPLAWDI